MSCVFYATMSLFDDHVKPSRIISDVVIPEMDSLAQESPHGNLSCLFWVALGLRKVCNQSNGLIRINVNSKLKQELAGLKNRDYLVRTRSESDARRGNPSLTIHLPAFGPFCVRMAGSGKRPAQMHFRVNVYFNARGHFLPTPGLDIATEIARLCTSAVPTITTILEGMDFEDFYTVPVYIAEALLRTLSLSTNFQKPSELSVLAAHGSKEYQSHASWSQNEDAVSDRTTHELPSVLTGEEDIKAGLESIRQNSSEADRTNCSSSGHGHDVLPFLLELKDSQMKLSKNLDDQITTRASESIRNDNDSRIFVALGSNVGNRLDAIERACAAIDKEPDMRIVRTSSLYETEPMYVEEQERFLNGVCEVRSSRQ